MKVKNIKVIFDTNVWISFLIGKRLQVVSEYIINGNIIIVTTDQLLTEIKDVAKRPKFKKYFPPKKVKELLNFLEVVAQNAPITLNNTLCKDRKDNFLLDLIESSKADILVTGDKELLELHPFKSADIISPAAFEKYLLQL